MNRQRAFCRFCGALTRRDPDPDGLTRCHAHSTVTPEHLGLPADPAADRLREAVNATEAVYSDTRGSA